VSFRGRVESRDKSSTPTCRMCLRKRLVIGEFFLSLSILLRTYPCGQIPVEVPNGLLTFHAPPCLSYVINRIITYDGEPSVFGTRRKILLECGGPSTPRISAHLKTEARRQKAIRRPNNRVPVLPRNLNDPQDPVHRRSEQSASLIRVDKPRPFINGVFDVDRRISWGVRVPAMKQLALPS